MRSTVKYMSKSFVVKKPLRIGLSALVLFVAPITSFLSPAYAHGGADSNLDVPMAVAPPTANLMYSADVDRSLTTGRLRHLGEGPLKEEEYYRLDVPTQDLVLSEYSVGIGRDFSFILPRLAKGYYALDWSVTSLGDHSDGSVILFQITVGDKNPDPVPESGTLAISEEETGSLVGEEMGSLQSEQPIDKKSNYVYALLSALFIAAIASIYLVLRRPRKFIKDR